MRRRLSTLVIVAVGLLLIAHTVTDYFTARDVAHNKDVIVTTCESANKLTNAIRKVLVDGIAGARRGEKVLPEFREQFEAQIRQNRDYLAKLFVVQHC